MKAKENVLVALAVVGALFTGYTLKTEPAIAQEASSNGYIALKLDATSTQDSGFALINTDSKTIMIYKTKYQKGSKKVSLELDAARSYKFDEQLESWKTEPRISDIEKAVKKAASRKK